MHDHYKTHDPLLYSWVRLLVNPILRRGGEAGLFHSQLKIAEGDGVTGVTGVVGRRFFSDEK
ncbi:hypothetical protein L8106_06879 [Lyngbya sp. PCC 8106]|nr:hypothetical protein L8106_06879 [Lyngbya sp. PCC 8106]